MEINTPYDFDQVKVSQNARALNNDDQKASNVGAMTDSNIKQEKVNVILSAFFLASDKV